MLLSFLEIFLQNAVYCISTMKVKILSRNPDDYMRETKRDIFKIPRNFDPVLHPFQEREYVRALNSVKLERVFAKPFLGSLDGHRDSIICLKKHPKSLSTVLTGACDGEVLIWNVSERKCVHSINAHAGLVRGLCITPSGDSFFSVGDDKNIKQWKLRALLDGEIEEPLMAILCKTIVTGIDHHWSNPVFATCGEKVDIWDESRAEPIKSFSWSQDTVSSLKFNPIETHILASTTNDRNIILYDMRSAAPVRKVILKLRSNAIAWNPMEAFIFTVANEDYNLYTFDTRKLNCPVVVHNDHIAAVLDVDFSPTGKEFVSGSFDKTIRIFPVNKGRSREVYHTKRMQRVSSVQWTLDNKFILSGSDEMNIRIWKANASEKLGLLEVREKVAFNYTEKLKEKYASHPQIRRIAKHRHVPKHVYNAAKELQTIHASQRRKEVNRIKHSKPGSYTKVPYKKKSIVKEEA